MLGKATQKQQTNGRYRVRSISSRFHVSPQGFLGHLQAPIAAMAARRCVAGALATAAVFSGRAAAIEWICTAGGTTASTSVANVIESSGRSFPDQDGTTDVRCTQDDFVSWVSKQPLRTARFSAPLVELKGQ